MRRRVLLCQHTSRSGSNPAAAGRERSFLATAAADCPQQPELPNCPCVERQDLRLMVVTHGALSDPFWAEVHEGVDEAAAGLLAAKGLFNGGKLSR